MQTINVVFKSLEELKNIVSSLPKDKEILVVIFSGVVDYLFLEQIRIFLASNIKNIKIIGTTTDGEVIDGVVTSREVILSFNIFDKTHIKTSFKLYNNNEEKSGEELVKDLIEDNTKLLLVFADGLNTNGDALLRGINRYAKDIIVAGGLAGDNKNFKNTYIFTEDGILRKGVVGVSFSSDELIVNNGYIFGWKGIGKKFKVTKSFKNKVYEIDNVSIFEIYKKYLGEHVLKLLPDIGIEFPLIVNNEYARACISKDDDGLIFAGEVPQDSFVQFGVADRESIKKLEEKAFKDICKLSIETIFTFSCMARRRVLKSDALQEISNLARYGKNAGFFTYGEFFTQNEVKLLNETFTFVTLSENKKTAKKFDIKLNLEEDECDNSKKSLITFINTTTKELEELNQNLEKRVKEEVEKNLNQEKILFLQHKQAQMGEMLSMIAHQWRQPLNTISMTASYIELLIEQHKIDKKEIKESLSKIINTTKNLSKIIDDFMEFTRPNLKKEKINIIEPINHALEMIKAKIVKNNILIKLDLKECFIFGHKSLFEQVILNLIVNSAEAYKEKLIGEKVIFIRNYKEKDFCILEVEDKAGGIDSKIQDRIFEPYFTTKGPIGTGLGLYMTKLIVEKEFNGNITFKNTDKGVKFIVKIKEFNDSKA